MKTLMITAMQSGAGKTVISCALMAALKKRGLAISAFKCGPDYIDPMFHESVLGIPSRNLDLFLQGESGVKRSLSRAKGDLAILEGAMGYYDGAGGTEEASAYQISSLTGTPAVLVLRPKGSGLTLAAQVRGMQAFRPGGHIRALILSECTERLADYLRPILERETGLPVLGFLPAMPEAEIGSRHLGLLTAAEMEDLSVRMEKLAVAAEQNMDLDRLIVFAGDYIGESESPKSCPVRCRIAVARDEAFCFTYEDTLDSLREAGAELCFFSPIRDLSLPDSTDGLYLPGGYPELYAERLSDNTALRQQIAERISAGLPTVAECGGFLYLQQSLENPKGQVFPMCAVLPGRGFRTERLQRFGYQRLKADEDSLLFRAGENVPAHEFHYWDSTECGRSLRSEKTDGRVWRCGYTGKNLYAAFPHLCFGGELPLAERFVKACEIWKASMKQ